jgi:nucleotide-binding universal stress UspA family protein
VVAKALTKKTSAAAHQAGEHHLAEPSSIGADADVSIEVVGGDARDVLNEVAAAGRASVIVVGARGGKGLSGWGSVATSVASNADVAVVVVPAT